MRAWVLIATVLAAVAIVVAWIRTPDSPNPTSISPVVSPQVEPPVELLVEPHVTDAPDAAAATTTADVSVDEHLERDRSNEDDKPVILGRRPVASAALVGQVVDETGSPISGAVVSWTPIPERLNWVTTTRFEVASEVQASSVDSGTDNDGKFEFETGPTMMEGLASVIWITHPDFTARAIRLASDRGEWPDGKTWSLTSSAPIRATVVGTSNSAVPGAEVIQQGLDVPSEDAAQPDRLAWLLRRELTAGSDGSVRLFPLDGTHRVNARLGELESPPWDGRPAPSVVLRVGECFVVGGALRRSARLSGSKAVSVTCESISGGHVVELGRTKGSLDTWGPITVPLTGAAEYRFELQGDDEGVQTQRQVVPAPHPGEELAIDFDVDPGYVLWFRVHDDSNAPIAGAEATAHWQHAGQTVTRTAGVRPDGYIAVWGCPEGTVSASFRAPGFVPTAVGHHELPEESDRYFEVELVRAGTIRGRVVAPTGPVQDFEIVVWPQGMSVRAKRYAFANRADGSFVVDEVPTTGLTILATAAGTSQSAPRNIHVYAEQETTLELELDASVVGVGQVVDVSSGAAVRDASVRVAASDGYSAIGVLGAPHHVTDDGSFSVAGLSSGRAYINVSAPGFSTYTASAAVVAGKADFGRVQLAQRQTLEVRLFHDEADDPTLYRVTVHGPDPTRNRFFDDEGLLRIESLSAGAHTITAHFPDQTRRQASLQLDPGRLWSVEFDAIGGATLRVETSDPAGGTPEAESYIEVKRITPEGTKTCTSVLDDQGNAVIHNVPPAIYRVALHGHPDTGSQILASARVELADWDDVTLRLDIGQGGHRFRVIDEFGTPIEGVSVALNDSGGGAGWSPRDLTDSEGLCTVLGEITGQVFAHLGHPERGYSFGHEVILGAIDDVHEIVFEAAVTTETVLMRRTGPVVGESGRFFSEQLTRAARGPASDELGRSVWTNLAPGNYVFVFDDEGYWPIHKPVTIGKGAAPIRVDLYRLCTIRVEVTNRGVPGADAGLFMQRVGGPTPLAKFLPGGFVSSSTGSMTTDSHGVVALTGVAEGLYEWAVTFADGAILEGQVDVHPGEDVRLRVER